MLGAVAAAVLLATLGLGFWAALPIVTVLMFGFGVLLERLFVRWLLRLDPLYNFLLTFGITLILVGPRQAPVRRLEPSLPGAGRAGGRLEIGGLAPSKYLRLFVAVFSVLVCLGVWMLLTRTGSG